MCLSISGPCKPLRNYLEKTTFLLLVCSHSASIPMLSELLLGLKTAWLTSTICCLYFHPSLREEMCCKSLFSRQFAFIVGVGFCVAQVENHLIRALVQKGEIRSGSSWQTESAVFPWWVTEHTSRVPQVQMQYYLVGGRWSYPHPQECQSQR